jgi:hypothetical protein
MTDIPADEQFLHPSSNVSAVQKSKAKTTLFLDLISHLSSMRVGGLGKVEGGG